MPLCARKVRNHSFPARSRTMPSFLFGVFAPSSGFTSSGRRRVGMPEPPAGSYGYLWQNGTRLDNATLARADGLLTVEHNARKLFDLLKTAPGTDASVPDLCKMRHGKGLDRWFLAGWRGCRSGRPSCLHQLFTPGRSVPERVPYLLHCA
jgi:hypothetical protein